MQDLLKLTDVVKNILTEDANTRNSDWELYYAVCKAINPRALTSKFGTVIRSHKEYGLPPFETVSRTRRKVVENHPDLMGSDDVEGGRWSYEVAFREYAKERV